MPFCHAVYSSLIHVINASKITLLGQLVFLSNDMDVEYIQKWFDDYKVDRPDVDGHHDWLIIIA